MNAEVYVGQPMWKKAEEYCNKVIELNQYTLGDYFEMFKPDNGADEKEIIFAEKVVREIDSKKAQGIGVFTVDGKMIDIAFYDGAKRIIELAKASGVYEGEL